MGDTRTLKFDQPCDEPAVELQVESVARTCGSRQEFRTRRLDQVDILIDQVSSGLLANQPVVSLVLEVLAVRCGSDKVSAIRIQRDQSPPPEREDRVELSIGLCVVKPLDCVGIVAVD